jgi:hypothetical protein
VTGHPPPGRQGRPHAGERPGVDGRDDRDSVDPTADTTTTVSVADDLRRRRAASWRCEPLEDGTGRRDPLDPVRICTSRPSTFGMDPAGVRAEAERCWDSGWLAWEIRYRFDLQAAA